MNKMFKIARREFIETVKTKTFLLSIILTPLLILGMGWVNSKFESDMKTSTKPARRVAVVDCTGVLAEDIKAVFDRYNIAIPGRPFQLNTIATSETEARIETLSKDVLETRLDGLLVIAPDAADEKPGKGKSQYYSKTKKFDDLDTQSTIGRLLNEAVSAKRYRMHNLSPQLIAQLSAAVPMEGVEVGSQDKGGGGGKQQMAMVMVPFFFMFLMFMGIMGASQGLLTSVIEEKNSRVMEVLLAAVSPGELMAGKILGLVGVGLTLIGIWGLASLGAAVHFGMSGFMSPRIMILFLIYYILGFMVVASMYAAIGSACNTLKEAQNLLGPVTMLFVLPMILWLPIAQNPEGTLARIFSYIPTTASMVMIVRVCASPELSLWQIAGTIAVLAASGLAIAWAAGKIFRTGILMYGKPPSLREMMRWVRER